MKAVRWTLLVVVLAVVGCAAYSPIKMSMTPNPIVKNEHTLLEGERLFGSYCAACHGDYGLGDGPAGEGLAVKPANLTELKWKSDGLLAMNIQNGAGVMPAWKEVLTEEQIWMLVEYIRHIPVKSS